MLCNIRVAACILFLGYTFCSNIAAIQLDDAKLISQQWLVDDVAKLVFGLQEGTSKDRDADVEALRALLPVLDSRIDEQATQEACIESGVAVISQFSRAKLNQTQQQLQRYLDTAFVQDYLTQSDRVALRAI